MSTVVKFLPLYEQYFRKSTEEHDEEFLKVIGRNSKAKTWILQSLYQSA